MAVMSVRNQYRGVNAHLHSRWQAEHKWNRFHNAYITYLVQHLKTRLRGMGYRAEMEESIQVRRVGDDLPRSPRPDIIVRDRNPLIPRRQPTAFPVETPTLPLTDLIDDPDDPEAPYYAVALYDLLPDGQPDEPVAWIELLSPTNKGVSKNAFLYLAKRRMLLESGLVFVEIDYLHETPATFERLPDYAAGAAGAHPYRVAVIDPRPLYHQARAALFGFDVDAPIPAVVVPLNAGDSVPCDLDLAYMSAFELHFFGDDVDYAALPLHFERYSPADQARIARRMLAVLQAAHAGHTLEDGPFPVAPVTLDEALHQIDTLRKLLA